MFKKLYYIYNDNYRNTAKLSKRQVFEYLNNGYSLELIK